MEERVVNGSALSDLLRRLCVTRISFERLKRAQTRWWKYLILGLVLVCSASMCLALPVHQGSQAFSVLKARCSSVVPATTCHQSAGLTSKRRELMSLDGDYENVPLIKKETGETVVEPRKEGLREEIRAESTTLHDNAVSADEDYESVALAGVVAKESDVKEQVENESQRIIQKGMESDGHANVSEGASAVKDSKADHSGVENFLDRLEESLGNEEDGRFNRTISEQEGVLETVARVGGRSFDDDEDDEVTEAEKEALKLIDTEILNVKQNENTGLSEAVGGIENATDMTWLDRIMGQADQPLRLEPPHPHMKDTSRDLGGNQSTGSQKKNFTRERVSGENSGHHQTEDVPRLIDRSDNEYVISNPAKNKMMLQEDLTLISDIVVVIVTAALGGTICGLLGQPVILGYLVAGMVVGPGGLHLVHELVQVETLAQFGVVFILFVLGVEFNPAKMQGIHNVTLGGGCLQIGTAMLLGGFLGATIPQGVFIGAFLSMSSTAVVVKCLMDSKMGGTEPGQIMLGTLILQDCALGLLLAVMPALAAKGSDAGTFAFALSRATALLVLFCGSVWILSKMLVPRFLRALVQLTKFNSELFLLGALGICLSLALISESLGLSLEVGAFVGGLVLSGGTHTEKTLHQVEPIRNLFAALFLASIGMVMHPVFLWEHIDILMASLAVVFLGKTFLFAVVVRGFGYSSKTSLSVGVALAQIGEFAFILLSRAQGLGLVSKKLYLLLMGTSAVSLVLTPFAFKIVIRLNPPSLIPFKKSTSKPLHNLAAHIPGDVNQDIPGTPEQGKTEPSPEGSFLNNGDSVDLEDGRGDRPSSPARVVMRRPYNPGVGGNWNEWRKEIASPDFF